MTGYKRPPRSTQFQKGHSGNPKGRPKGSGNFKTDLLQVMGQTVFITENGQRRAVSGSRAVFIKLLHDALHGDRKALADLTAHLLKHDFDADTRPEAEPVTESRHNRGLPAPKLNTTLNKRKAMIGLTAEVRDAIFRQDFIAFLRKAYEILYPGEARPEAEPVSENDRVSIADFLRRNSIPPSGDEKP